MKEKTDDKKAKPADKWIQVASVSETLGCTDKYVYSLIQEGALKGMKLGERAIRVSEQSLKSFIAARVINTADYFAPEDDPPSKQKKEEVKPPVARSNWMDR